jgi:hypothetical protein
VPLPENLGADAITDSGIVGGATAADPPNEGFVGYTMPPRIVNGECFYLAEDMQRFWIDDGEIFIGATALAVNQARIAVGWALVPNYKAALWLADGTAVELGIAVPGAASMAVSINDDGLVAVWSDQPAASGPSAGVVVPQDLDENGAPDNWFADFDADGVVSRNSIITECADAQFEGRPAPGPISDRESSFGGSGNAVKDVSPSLSSDRRKKGRWVAASGLGVCFATSTVCRDPAGIRRFQFPDTTGPSSRLPGRVAPLKDDTGEVRVGQDAGNGLTRSRACLVCGPKWVAPQ